jgi:tetratricopeptide (TPR) repeat protein
MNRTRGKYMVIAAGALVFLLHQAGTGTASPSESVSLKVKADQMLKRGQLDRAIPLYGRVILSEPRFANAYYNLATAYYLRGKFEMAAASLESFLNLQPLDAEALYNLGCLKLRLGNLKQALECFLRAERCPYADLIPQKIQEALQFMKDLQNQTPETQKLVAFLLSGSAQSLLTP